MTEKQIQKIKLAIKKQRSALSAEKRKFGGFMDSGARRYLIADLYLSIADYKGAISYKKWFDANFSDDSGDYALSLNWAIAYHGLGKIKEAKIYTIDTAFQNVYLHGLLLEREQEKIDMDNSGYEILNYADDVLKECRKVLTETYIDWLSTFMETEEYKKPLNKYIALNKLLKDENDFGKRSEFIKYISELKEENRTSEDE